jgi:hypothetical protein
MTIQYHTHMTQEFPSAAQAARNVFCTAVPHERATTRRGATVVGSHSVKGQRGGAFPPLARHGDLMHGKPRPLAPTSSVGQSDPMPDPQS